MPSSPQCWRPKPCTEMQAASHLRAFAHALPRLALPSFCPVACLQSLYHRLVHPDLWPLCHPAISLGSWSTLQDALHGPPPCSSGLPAPTIRIMSPLCVRGEFLSQGQCCTQVDLRPWLAALEAGTARVCRALQPCTE